MNEPTTDQRQILLNTWGNVSNAINAVTACGNAVAMFPQSGMVNDLPRLIEALLDTTVEFESLLDRVESVEIESEAQP